MCVPFVLHISINQRFIIAKINLSSLNNASPAIMEKYAEYVSAELKGVEVGMRSVKLALDLARKYETTKGKHSSQLWQTSWGLVHRGFPFS